MLDRTTRYEALEEPRKRDEATEAILRSAFVLRDVPVLLPAADAPYDLVVEIGGRFHRIQCKTAYGKREGTVAFETVSSRQRGVADRAEHFAVYDPINDNRYLIPASDSASGTMEIRVRESTADRRIGVDWYEEHLLDERLAELRRSSAASTA